MSFLDTPISLNLLFGPRRMLGPINLQVVVSEQTSDTLTITKQPIQQGASITDHAYQEPTTFSATVYFKAPAFDLTSNPFSQNNLAKIYAELLKLQSDRVPFDITTPKRFYKNMLISSLGLTTDVRTENTLAINFTCQQVLIVNVDIVQVSRLKQKNPGATDKTQAAGRKTPDSAAFSTNAIVRGQP